MSSSFLYRKVDQSYSAGAVEVAWGAADEERIYDMPNLLSWFTAETAYFDAGTGTYRDKGPRGNNWVNATAAQQPTPVANWQSTGRPALAFDGVNDRIPANFLAPVGPMTLVAVCDTFISDATQVVMGSNIGSALSNQYYLGYFHQGVTAFCKQGGPSGATSGSSGTTSIPHIIVANFDSINSTIDVQKDGGSWTTTSADFTYTNTDVTMQLGAYRTATGNLYTGSMAEAFVFTGAMKGAADLATLVAAMKAKYGIA